MNYDRKTIEEFFSREGLSFQLSSDVPDGSRDAFEILFTGFLPASKLANELKTLPSLKMIQTLSAGVDRLPFHEIPEHVLICSNAGAYSLPIAEHAVAMLLSLGKKLKANERKMAQGVFEQEDRNVLFRGRTLGVLGYGGIGRTTAEIARCLGMKIYGIGRRACNECDMYGGLEMLDDMLSRSDAVLVSIPLNKHTRHLIDARKLALMKEDAMIVNVARAEIIVERDLYEHLRTHPAFGAALDVWWEEPREGEKFAPRHDFLSLPNLVASPHNSGLVDGIDVMALSSAISNMGRFASGKKPLNIVSRSDYI